MSYTGDNTAQLPAFGAEPPYSTAVEGLSGTRLGQHETNTAPSTFGYTESDRPVTNLSAFGENVTDGRGSPYEPSFGDNIQRPQSFIDELTNRRGNLAAQMAGMNLAAEEEREIEDRMAQQQNGIDADEAPSIGQTAAYTFADGERNKDSPPGARSETLERLLRENEGNTNERHRAGQMRMPNV